jgi:iron complex transport system ATP-binding protein
MLKVDHIQFLIGEKRILHDISATFEPCKIHGIIGPNGSGKSTLLKNICRIWEPQAGTIFVDSQDYRAMPRRELSKIITMVPQNTTISFPISVYDIVAMGRHPHLGRFQTLSKKDKRIIGHALEITQIEALKDRNINELSGGEGQLSIIARALATEASLILLDEPTSNLDIKHALTIMNLLRDLRETGKTILVSIHDLNLARRYCDTISIINRGEVFFTGAPSDAFSKENIREVFAVNMMEIEDASKSFLHFYE